MKSPAAVYKLADAPAIVHAREISIRQQVLRIIIFFSVNMSAPPFSFIGFCEA